MSPEGVPPRKATTPTDDPPNRRETATYPGGGTEARIFDGDGRLKALPMGGTRTATSTDDGGDRT